MLWLTLPSAWLCRRARRPRARHASSSARVISGLPGAPAGAVAGQHVTRWPGSAQRPPHLCLQHAGSPLSPALSSLLSSGAAAAAGDAVLASAHTRCCLAPWPPACGDPLSRSPQLCQQRVCPAPQPQDCPDPRGRPCTMWFRAGLPPWVVQRPAQCLARRTPELVPSGLLATRCQSVRVSGGPAVPLCPVLRRRPQWDSRLLF